MFTGKSMIGHGVGTVHDVLPDDQLLFSEHLQRAGYTTALFGKLHVSGRMYERDTRHPHDGFDVYENSISPYPRGGTYNAYETWLGDNHPEFLKRLADAGSGIGNFPEEASFTRWVANRACAFLENYTDSSPFFCYLGILDPHDPYNDYPASYAGRVDRDAFPDPALTPYDRRTAVSSVRREHEHGYLGAVADYTREQIDQMRVGYYASVAHIDDEVGRVLRTLEQRGFAENTVVVFLSDHGDMLGDHGLLGKGGYFFDESTRVPFLVRHPGRIQPGTRVRAPIQLHDVAATCCAIAGISEREVSASMPDSRNVVEIAELGGDDTAERPAVCLYRNTGINRDKVHWDPPIHGTMLRLGRHKINVYHGDPAAGDTEGELYDLHTDPHEVHNLWADPESQKLRAELLLRVLDWTAEQTHVYHDGRAGEMFPPTSAWMKNNPM
jgi:arylsulfatase A-like enzyme